MWEGGHTAKEEKQKNWSRVQKIQAGGCFLTKQRVWVTHSFDTPLFNHLLSANLCVRC